MVVLDCLFQNLTLYFVEWTQIKMLRWFGCHFLPHHVSMLSYVLYSLKPLII